MKSKTSAPAKSKTAARSGKANQGEGDKRSAKRFNRDQKEFVQSAQGQDAIKRASDVVPEDEAGLAQAEREGASRAKGEDPAVSRHRDAPAHETGRDANRSD